MNSYLEIDHRALAANVSEFCAIAPMQKLMIVVKANAYGQGIVEVSKTAINSGADYLAVFELSQALKLRKAGLDTPILLLGQLNKQQYLSTIQNPISITAASIKDIEDISHFSTGGLKVHVKFDSGLGRQGINYSELEKCKAITKNGAIFEGFYTHYADIEDTTDHSFAMEQLAVFNKAVSRLSQLGIKPGLIHASCTAAALLFPETYFNMLRVGVGTYGLWPSKETFVSAGHLNMKRPQLRQVMSWKSRIMQIKELPAGSYIGYGRTHKLSRNSRTAVIPVGYYNGYPRTLSNKSYVLINGQRAALLGRVMMNMIVVDITDIGSVDYNSEVVLMGKSGDDIISAEQIAAWAGTINYEIVTRAEPYGTRKHINSV